jgi:hypothetical protein
LDRFGAGMDSAPAGREECGFMMRHVGLIAGVVVLLTSSATAQNRTVVQTGREMYVANECARCQKVSGRGNHMWKLDGVASKLSVEDMRRWLTAPGEMEAKLEQRPKIRMSSRKSMKLSEGDITALVAYLMTLKQ